jgi:hypothetical protein
MFALLVLFGCGDKGDTAEELEPVEAMSFTQIENEVLGLSCAFSSCHGAGAGALTLDGVSDYARLVDAPSSQIEGELLVIPGNAEGSYLIKKLRGEAGIIGDPMPPGTALDAEVLDGIAAWVDAGALQ